MNYCYNATNRGKPKYSEENLSQCKLARTDPAARDLGLNAGFWDVRPTANHLKNWIA